MYIRCQNFPQAAHWAGKMDETYQLILGTGATHKAKGMDSIS